MIASIATAFITIVRKPVAVLPAVVVPVWVFGLLFLLQDFLGTLFFEAFLLGTLPETSGSALPVHFLGMYPLESIALAVFLFVSAIAWIATAFFYAKVANQVEGGSIDLGDALSSTIGNIGRIVFLTVFFAALAVLFGILAWIAAIVGEVIEILGLVLGLALALLGFYLGVKIAFTVPAMAIDDSKPKDALVKSWAFTQNRFWGALVFLAIVLAIYLAIAGIGESIELEMPSEEIGIVAFMVFWIVGAAFANLAAPLYFIKKGIGKS